MKLNQCDSCGKQAPQVDIGVMRPTADGADGWTTINIHVYRKTTPPAYHPTPQAGTYYNSWPVQLDLCPECARKTFEASGCMQKIVAEEPTLTSDEAQPATA